MIPLNLEQCRRVLPLRKPNARHIKDHRPPIIRHQHYFIDIVRNHQILGHSLAILDAVFRSKQIKLGCLSLKREGESVKGNVHGLGFVGESLLD